MGRGPVEPLDARGLLSLLTPRRRPDCRNWVGTNWGDLGSWESCTFGATKETSEKDRPRLDTACMLKVVGICPCSFSRIAGRHVIGSQGKRYLSFCPSVGVKPTGKLRLSTDGDPASAGFVPSQFALLPFVQHLPGSLISPRQVLELSPFPIAELTSDHQEASRAC